LWRRPPHPPNPAGWDPSLSPLKGGEGLVSAGIILVERDASRRTALRGAGKGVERNGAGEGLSAAEDRFYLFFPCSIRLVGKRSRI
jgi:hypothetical protein